MLCILCLTVSDKIIKIFEDEGVRLNIASAVMLHFSIQPSPENPNNEAVCISCWNELSNFHKFYKKVEQAHSYLINTWIEAATQSRDILSTAIEIAGIKQESEDESDLELSSADEEDDDDDEFYNESDFDDLKLRHRPPLNIDELIHKHMKLHCDLCKKPMYSFYMLRRHFESAHEEIGYVVCCKVKFKRRSLLANHIYLKHTLVDLCNECGQLLADCKAMNLHGPNDVCSNSCISSINVTNSVTLHFKSPIQKDKRNETWIEIRKPYKQNF